MKRLFITFVFLLSAIFFNNISQAQAQVDSFHEDGSWHLSIEPLYGIRYGTLGEYVYYSDNSNDILSYLEWDIKPLTFAGIKLEGGWKGINLKASVNFFVPSACGRMADSDFLQDYYTDNGNRSVKTNYSEHENHLDAGIAFNIELSTKFYPSSKFSIAPVIGLDYQYLSLYAENGTAWYGTNSFNAWDDVNNRTVTKFSGRVIEYKRYELYTWLGVATEFKPFQKLYFGLSLFISPYTHIEGIDSHLLRSIYFFEIMEDCFTVFKGALSANYVLNKYVTFRCEFSGIVTREIHCTKAYTSIESATGPYIRNGSDTGASSAFFDIILSAKFNFQW